MMDILATELALEEHRQGMTLGKAGHCEACDDEVRHQRYAAMMAACTHDNWSEIRVLELPGPLYRICDDCGLREAT
jgi:hypothetical protein